MIDPNSIVLRSLDDLKNRNLCQTLPFYNVCTSYSKIWNENRNLENQLADMKRQIAIIQRETSDLIAAGDSNTVADNIRVRLQKLYDDLKEKNEEDMEKRVRADIGRKVSEQNKLILNMQEEIRIYKSELATFRESNSLLTVELETSRKCEMSIANELREIRTKMFDSDNKMRSLELENAALVQRMLSDKEKMAEEMNKMNYKADTQKATSSFLLSSAMSLFNASVGVSEKPVEVSNASSAHGSDTNAATTDSRPRVRTHSSSGGKFIDQDYVSVEDDIASQPQSIGIPSIAWKTATLGSQPVEINDIDTVYNDKYVAVAGSDSCITILDINRHDAVSKSSKSNHVAKFEVKNSPIYSLSSKGGEFILAGYSDKSCRVWSMKTSSMVTQLSGHNSKVTGVKWIGSCSGYSQSVKSNQVKTHEKAISVSSDRTIRLWDVSSGRAIVTIQANSGINSVDVTSDGNSCVTGHQDGHVRFWDINSGKCVGELSSPHASNITHVSFGSRGDFSVALACSKDNSISYMDCYTYNPIKVLRHSDFRTTCDWSKASFSYHNTQQIVAGSNDGSICIWNSLTGEVETVLSKLEHNAPVISSTWTRFGLFTADRVGKLILWR